MSNHTQPPDPDTVRRFQDDDDESIEHEDERDRPEEPDTREKQQHQKVQRQLDEALAATFPASDPVAISTSHG